MVILANVAKMQFKIIIKETNTKTKTINKYTCQVNNGNSRNTKSFSTITTGIRKLRRKSLLSLSLPPWNSFHVSSLDTSSVKQLHLE